MSFVENTNVRAVQPWVQAVVIIVPQLLGIIVIVSLIYYVTPPASRANFWKGLVSTNSDDEMKEQMDLAKNSRGDVVSMSIDKSESGASSTGSGNSPLLQETISENADGRRRAPPTNSRSVFA